MSGSGWRYTYPVGFMSNSNPTATRVLDISSNVGQSRIETFKWKYGNTKLSTSTIFKVQTSDSSRVFMLVLGSEGSSKDTQKEMGM